MARQNLGRGIGLTKDTLEDSTGWLCHFAKYVPRHAKAVEAPSVHQYSFREQHVLVRSKSRRTLISRRTKRDHGSHVISPQKVLGIANYSRSVPFAPDRSTASSFFFTNARSGYQPSVFASIWNSFIPPYPHLVSNQLCLTETHISLPECGASHAEYRRPSTVSSRNDLTPCHIIDHILIRDYSGPQNAPHPVLWTCPPCLKNESSNLSILSLMM
jgi:hypothetical protein